MEISERIKALVEAPMPKDPWRTEIIVLSNDTVSLTERAVVSIIRNTDMPYNLTVMETKGYPARMGTIFNKLVKRSDCPYISLFCSDAIASPGWLRQMLGAFRDKQVALVAALTDHPPVNEEMNVNPNSGLKQVSADSLSMPVSVISRKALRKVGYHDEGYYLYGHDPDLLRRFEASGYKLYLDTDTIVHHDGGSTTKRLYTEEEIKMIDVYNKEYESAKIRGGSPSVQ